MDNNKCMTLIIDDPNDMDDHVEQSYRENIMKWFDKALKERENGKCLGVSIFKSRIYQHNLLDQIKP
jgi:hypothetical protein